MHLPTQRSLCHTLQEAHEGRTTPYAQGHPAQNEGHVQRLKAWILLLSLIKISRQDQSYRTQRVDP